MTTRVAIYGFGHIGRHVFRAIHSRPGDDIEVAAIALESGTEAATDPALAAHLLQFDTNQGRFDGAVRLEGDALLVDGARIPLVSASAPAGLPWGSMNIDVAVVAADGGTVSPAAHLEAGADKVVVTGASADADLLLIRGVNEGDYRSAEHHVVAIGSDTTNALVPLLAAIDAALPIQSAMVMAIHAYSADQRLIDGAATDPRRARSAAASIVPTSTRASEALHRVLPEIADKVSCYAARVPVSIVSMIEVTAHFEHDVAGEAINAVLREAAVGRYAGVLGISDLPLVSTDFIGNPHSAVVDAPFTLTIGPLAKISAWYDNEWGVANRAVDAIRFVAGSNVRSNGTG